MKLYKRDILIYFFIFFVTFGTWGYAFEVEHGNNKSVNLSPIKILVTNFNVSDNDFSKDENKKIGNIVANELVKKLESQKSFELKLVSEIENKDLKNPSFIKDNFDYVIGGSVDDIDTQIKTTSSFLNKKQTKTVYLKVNSKVVDVKENRAIYSGQAYGETTDTSDAFLGIGSKVESDMNLVEDASSKATDSLSLDMLNKLKLNSSI